jgi:tagatose 1,6-diphosphate aldolase
MFQDTSNLFDSEIILKLHRTADAIPQRNWVPAYHFKIYRKSDDVEVGFCDLRIGHTEGTFYGGNIGYTVYEAYRGHHFAGKACLLLFTLAKKHDMGYVYITCDPDNFASRKTCEFAGGELEGIFDLPPHNEMYLEGDKRKCVFRFIL